MRLALAPPYDAARGDGHSSSVPSPSSTTNASSSAEWQCGIASSSFGPRRDHFSPDCDRAARLRDHAVAVLVDLDVVERDDVRRPLARIRELELADLGLDVPRVVDAALRPHVAEAHRLRARQPAVLRPDGACRKRARRARRGLRGSVCSSLSASCTIVSPARISQTASSCHSSPEPPRTKKISSARLCEWGGVERRPGSMRMRLTPMPFAPAAFPSALPRRRHRALLAADAVDLVPVRDHARIMSTAIASSTRSTARCARSSPSSARPRLRLANELAQLREQRRRVRALALERLDPVEPLDHRTRFVHAFHGRARSCVSSLPEV